jgi:hypothetical protein
VICAENIFICIAAPLPAAAPMLRPGIAPDLAPGVAPALFYPLLARALKKGVGA